MNKSSWLIVMCAMLTCGVVLAQDGVIQPDLPWMKEVLAFLSAVPYVGKYIKIIVEVMAAVTVVCTALVGFLKVIFSISYIAMKPFSLKASEAILKFEQKILPWFKYLSMMNAQKEELEKANAPKIML